MMQSFLIGFIWGFFEGTWFFIVPDVGLSFIALKGWKHAVVATLATILGSLIAACSIYAILHAQPQNIYKFQWVWNHLPGCYRLMFHTINDQLREHGAIGLLSGPSSGIPYRFYVSQAFMLNISLWSILLWTPLARLERIFLAPLVTLGLKKGLTFAGKKYSFLTEAKIDQSLKILLSVYWVAIYIWYWFFLLPRLYS